MAQRLREHHEKNVDKQKWIEMEIVQYCRSTSAKEESRAFKKGCMRMCVRAPSSPTLFFKKEGCRDCLASIYGMIRDDHTKKMWFGPGEDQRPRLMPSLMDLGPSRVPIRKTSIHQQEWVTRKPFFYFKPHARAGVQGKGNEKCILDIQFMLKNDGIQTEVKRGERLHGGWQGKAKRRNAVFDRCKKILPPSVGGLQN